MELAGHVFLVFFFFLVGIMSDTGSRKHLDINLFMYMSVFFSRALSGVLVDSYLGIDRSSGRHVWFPYNTLDLLGELLKLEARSWVGSSGDCACGSPQRCPKLM